MRSRRREETRKNVLAATEVRFARQGYDATSVAEICQSAGISEGAFPVFPHEAGHLVGLQRIVAVSPIGIRPLEVGQPFHSPDVAG